MRIIKVLGLICFLTIGALAQNSGVLEGKLLLRNSYEKSIGIRGTPESNEKVVVTSTNDKNIVFETITDKNGYFRIENIPPGKYSVAVYLNPNGGRAVPVFVETEMVTVRFGKASKVELYVESQLNTVRETVTVSANLEQSIVETSKTVNIIDSQELRDRADFSLIESLRSIPGFRIQQLGGFGRTANIKTRGLRNQDTAILIDGIRFRDVSAITGDASAFLSDFTLTSVDKIEVLRGSGSSLYGTNAVGGTIDFQTPKPPTGF
ncbi:MAG: TonB-dependent receptor, partial [Pyrinomonadaceae bacterium]|nr:TonB-dependent receptor [Pyrinomonadaceae bacterium]